MEQIRSQLQDRLRNLPSVDRVLSQAEVKALTERFSRDLITNLVRLRLEEIRLAVMESESCPSLDEIVASVVGHVEKRWQPTLRPVINATGVILHTNLGRAALSQEAIAAASLVSRGYSNLEFDLETGQRGSRNQHLEHLLCQLTQAEAALVVNNNASAVLLALTALAKGREVIISRGQAVEIGGGFRIPDVMHQSSAKLVEVGTTNRTYLQDYEQAITPRTVALLRVHTSNFRLMGFTHSVSLPEMVDLAASHNLLLLDDLGSGCLLDTTAFALRPEPTVQASVASGADLIFFSGDKLLGGPQAGIIVGRKALIDKLKKHPLARAVRIDKMNLAALSATFLHYLRNEAVSKVPVWRMISTSPKDIEERAKRWAEALGGVAKVIDGRSMVGGGSLPEESLTTKLVAISIGSRGREKGLSAQELARRLRNQNPPVIGRIERDLLLLDPRTVLPEEDETLLNALRRAIEAEETQ